MIPSLILSCGVALGIFAILGGVIVTIGRSHVPLEKRIDEYAAFVSAEESPTGTKSPEGSRRRGAPEGLTRYLRGELARAALAITVSEYILFNLLTTFLGFIVGFFVFRQNILLGVLGAIFGFYMPTAYVRYAQDKRRAAFVGQIENTIILIANALRSGYGLMQSIEAVGKQVPPPMSEELGRVIRESTLGVSTETALANLVKRNPSVDIDLVITSINVSRATGGNLAEVLDTIAAAIRDRVRVSGEIQVITSQQRLSALILTFLPVILGLALFALNPDYFSPLWQSNCGIVLILVGAVLIIIGNLIIRRIIAIDY